MEATKRGRIGGEDRIETPTKEVDLPNDEIKSVYREQLADQYLKFDEKLYKKWKMPRQFFSKLISSKIYSQVENAINTFF